MYSIKEPVMVEEMETGQDEVPIGDTLPTLISPVRSRPPMRRRLIANSSWNLAAYVVSTVVGIVSIPLYIRLLGVEHYGLMVLLSSILVPIGLLNLGFGQATIKYVAESIGRGDAEEAGSYVRTTLLVNIVVGLLGMALITLGASLLANKVFRIAPADRQLAEVGFFWVAVSWLINQVSATYQGVPAAFQKYNLLAVGTSLGTSVSIVVGLLALVSGGGLLKLMQWRIAWSIVMVIIWVLIARKLLPRVSLRPRLHRVAFRRSINFGFWDTLASLGALFSSQTDRFLLGAYVSTAAVGLYNIAWTIQATIYNGIYQMGTVLFPAISDLEGSGQDQRAVQLTIRSGWFLSVATILLMGPMAIFAHDLLRLFVSEAIADSVTGLLQILAIAGMLSSGTVSVNQYIYGIGKTQWGTIMSIASGIVILIGGVILIPAYGLMGAGWTQILAIVLTRPPILGFLWRSLLREQVPAGLFFTYLFSPAVVGVGVTLLLVLIRMQLVWLPGWIGLIVGSVGCAVILLVSILGADLVLPAGEERRASVRQLLTQVQSQARLHWSGFMMKLVRAHAVSVDKDRL